MTLSTHGVIGGAIGAFLPGHHILAFVAGFLSHFVLDSIPHWDYSINSLQSKDNKKVFARGTSFFIDVVKVVADACLGFLIPYIAFSSGVHFDFFVNAVFFGAFGAMVPDGLQFLYYKIPNRLLVTVQKFHKSIHAKRRLDMYPIIGPLLQVLLIVFVVLFVRAFL